VFGAVGVGEKYVPAQVIVKGVEDHLDRVVLRQVVVPPDLVPPYGFGLLVHVGGDVDVTLVPHDPDDRLVGRLLPVVGHPLGEIPSTVASRTRRRSGRRRSRAPGTSGKSPRTGSARPPPGPARKNRGTFPEKRQQQRTEQVPGTDQRAPARQGVGADLPTLGQGIATKSMEKEVTESARPPQSSGFFGVLRMRMAHPGGEPWQIGINIGGCGSMPRREFVKKTSLLAVGGAVTQFPYVVTGHAEPDDPIRVGVIGCGGRGTGAALNILGAQTRVVYPRTGYHTENALPNARIQVQNVKVTALADLFRDRLDQCRAQLTAVGTPSPKTTASRVRCVQEADGASGRELRHPRHPPHFRPATLRAAVEGASTCSWRSRCRGRPGGAVGHRIGRTRREKGARHRLRRPAAHQSSYVEAAQRIRDGAIGEIVECRAYWNGGDCG